MKFQDMINTVINDDCLDIMKDIPDKSIDLILTDAPYGISFCSSRTNRKETILNDGFDDWQNLMKLVLPEWKRILTDTGCCCCCCCGGGAKPVTAILTMEIIKHFNLIQTLVWKKFIGLGWKYRPAYENILVFSKSKDNYNFYDTSSKCSNVIEGINQDIPNSEEHPTQKPPLLMKKLIEIHSLENHLVLDCFMGTGATLIACKVLKRRFIGIEKELRYCKIAEDRLKQYDYELFPL